MKMLCRAYKSLVIGRTTSGLNTAIQKEGYLLMSFFSGNKKEVMTSF